MATTRNIIRAIAVNLVAGLALSSVAYADQCGGEIEFDCRRVRTRKVREGMLSSTTIAAIQLL